jgi:hypothetical protein
VTSRARFVMFLFGVPGAAYIAFNVIKYALT